MKKTSIMLLFIVVMTISILPMSAFAHHVGDKTIPGQDYQVENDWLNTRAHMSSPWYDADTDLTFNNERTLHLATFNELSEAEDMRNDNSTLHETGEQFDHIDLWPAFTGRYPVVYVNSQQSFKKSN